MLNSRSEYDRCRIPRLVVEERDEEEIKTMEQAKVLENIKNRDREQRTWEQQRLLDKSTMSKKQLTETERGGRSKKRKFASSQMNGGSKKIRPMWTNQLI